MDKTDTVRDRETLGIVKKEIDKNESKYCRKRTKGVFIVCYKSL